MRRLLVLAATLLQLAAVVAQAPSEWRRFSTNTIYPHWGFTSEEWRERGNCSQYTPEFSQDSLTDIELIRARIPVVFHFIGLQVEPSQLKLSVGNQIDVLNQVFGSLNVLLPGATDSARLQMIFYPISPKDAPNTGIISEGILNYPTMNQAEPNNDLKNGALGGVPPLSPEKYLNVWVGDFEGETGGFAQFPGGPSETDGIVIDWKFFGPKNSGNEPLNRGKTLVHLVGNYLNLNEIWGPGPLCADDGVADTPKHNAPNYKCYEGFHFSTCDGVVRESIGNYMDAVPDTCMSFFTLGQRQRMLQTLLWPGGRNFILYMGKLSEDISENNRWITLSPNPSNGEFLITASEFFPPETELNMVLVDMAGKTVFRMQSEIGPIEKRPIDLSSLKAGVYNLRFSWRDGSWVEKIVIF